jgi:hypothetical protein
MARRETFANDAETTLNGAISDSQTTILVDDGSEFPATGNFRLLCDGEIMHCTARSGNTLTVNRGIEGRTAASHASGATITHILTQESLLRVGQDNIPLYGNTSRPPFGIFDASGNIIDSSDFTIINQNSTVITDDWGSIHLRKPPNALSDQNITALMRSATVPFTQVIAFQFACSIANTADNQHNGIAIGDSSGKLIVFGPDDLTEGGMVKRRIAAWRYNSPTAYADQASISAKGMVFADVIWLKVEVTSSTVKYFYSPDGIEWVELHSEVDDAFLGTIDRVGVFLNSRSTLFPNLMRVLHWSTE